MILSYFALAILIIMIVVIVYAFIWVHDIPYMMAKKRNHPNLHAIHIACWLSLFTLHALWPFVFLWAISKKPQMEVQIVGDSRDGAAAGTRPSLESSEAVALRKTIGELQRRIEALEARPAAGGKA